MSQPWPVHLQSTSESDPASLSPRTALLSPPPFDDVDEPRRIPRGPGVRFRRERERAHSSLSSRDLLDMLVNEEYESKQTRKILYTAFDRLEHETKRADAAEVRIEEVIQRARDISEGRIAAQQQAARAQEELKLYKMQLDNAQKEILRAQDVLKAIEAQRDEAEAIAVSARSKARRLNEERLIELAREEGRRLGFEEGVRRGRRMGYREAYESGIDDRREDMREVATEVVDRLLEARDGPEEIEVLDQPTPVRPPSSISRPAPEVHRLETEVNSSLDQRHGSRSRRDSSASRSTLRRAPEPVIHPAPTVEPRVIRPGIPTIPISVSQASRPQSVSQPWAGPSTDPPFSRPVSIQHSPRSTVRPEIHIPPDNYIPTADSNHHIALPPPHELQRNIPSPTPSHHTLGPASERGRSRDHPYGSHPPRRGSDDDSLASGKQSAASSISQLDIVGLPTGARNRDRPQGLSVIHEDASSRSERMTDSQTITSTPQARRNSFVDTRGSETPRRDRKSRQQFADELRYSDPSTPEQWRRQSELRSQQPRDGPPRHVPSQITVPTPLSPPRVLQQPDSRHRRTASERQGRSETRSENRDQRRRLSSDSSVPEINVEPPSGPPSDAPSRGRGNVPASGYLSPDHANIPLPVPAPSGTNGRSSPVTPNSSSYPQGNPPSHIYAVASDGQIPPGFIPSPTTNGPSQGSAMPSHMGGGVPPHHHVPHRASSERESGRPRSPISFYSASQGPAGATYPVPPISRSATFSGGFYAGSNPSITSEGRRRRDSLNATGGGLAYAQSAGSNASEGGRRRRDSLSATAGMTPGPRGKPVQTAGSVESGGRDAQVSRRQSNASLASQQSRPYSRYDPNVYNDPAYLASTDSLVDSVTGANTAANGGGGGPVRPVRIQGSPAYMYATLRTNE